MAERASILGVRCKSPASNTCRWIPHNPVSTGRNGRVRWRRHLRLYHGPALLLMEANGSWSNLPVPGFQGEGTKVWSRRILVVAARSGEGQFTN
jgi:hypothetical protein